MKYSFMSFSTPNAPLDEMLELAVRCGYDGIEPRIATGHAHGVELDTDAAARRDIRMRARDVGAAIGCVASDCRFANPATTAKNVEDARRCIDLAADIGARRIRVFGGQMGEGISRDDAISIVVDALSSVADEATARGVILCMETHDDWCDPKHVAAVLKQIDHPAIGANWDVEHPVRTGAATMEEAFETLRPWIRHLHIHDGDKTTRKHVPIGTGAYDHRLILELLRSINYDGYLSGEWIGWDEPYEVHLPREVATLRAYEAELGV